MNSLLGPLWFLDSSVFIDGTHRLCYISCCTRDPFISPFNHAFHVPIPCSKPTHTSFSERRDQWSKSPIPMVTTDWIAVNMWFKVANQILSSENFELGPRHRVRCLNWEEMYSSCGGSGTCPNRKGQRHGRGKEWCKFVERVREREIENKRKYFFTSCWFFNSHLQSVMRTDYTF